MATYEIKAYESIEDANEALALNSGTKWNAISIAVGHGAGTVLILVEDLPQTQTQPASGSASGPTEGSAK